MYSPAASLLVLLLFRMLFWLVYWPLHWWVTFSGQLVMNVFPVLKKLEVRKDDDACTQVETPVDDACVQTERPVLRVRGDGCVERKPAIDAAVQTEAVPCAQFTPSVIVYDHNDPTRGERRVVRIEAAGRHAAGAERSTVSGSVQGLANGVKVHLEKRPDVPGDARTVAPYAGPDAAGPWDWTYEPGDGVWSLLHTWTQAHGVIVLELQKRPDGPTYLIGDAGASTQQFTLHDEDEDSTPAPEAKSIPQSSKALHSSSGGPPVPVNSCGGDS